MQSTIKLVDRWILRSSLLGLLFVPLEASAARIVFPQAVVGPTSKEAFEIELALSNRNPNEEWRGTLRLLRQSDLAEMEALEVTALEGVDVPVQGGSWDVEIPALGGVQFRISSPKLQVGVMVIDSEDSVVGDLVPTFFYRLWDVGAGKITDLIAVQPAFQAALVYNTLVSQVQGFSVGIALVSEVGIEQSGTASSPETQLTVQITLKDGTEYLTPVWLGGEADQQRALFPGSLFPGLPADFEAARLTVSASSPVYCTLMGVGAPPQFEDVQLAPTPALVQTSALFPLQAGWTLAEGGGDLLNHSLWECASSIIREVPGGLLTSPQAGYATVTNRYGPLLKPAGDFGVLTSLLASESSEGGVILVGRLAQGPQWYSNLRRLDMAVQDGQLVVQTFVNSPTPVSQTFLQPGTLQGEIQLELQRSGEHLKFFVDGEPVGQVSDPGLFEDETAFLGLNPAPGNSMVVYGVAAERPRSSSESLEILPPAAFRAVLPQDPSLRAAAEARGISIGAAASPSVLSVEPIYADTLGSQFNMLTAENAMKWGPIHPAPDQYAFCEADALVQFAQANNMMLRGHTLVWHQQLPTWLTGGSYSREELIAILRDHIRTVVGRYKGKVREWDVVNEAVSDSSGLRSTLFLQVIGPEYIDMAFEWAHQEDPSARLFYNDYSIAEVNSKSDRVYALLKDMKERGIPVHGVGFQGHVGVDSGLKPDKVKVQQNLQRFAALGLETNFTEVDVRIFLPVSLDELEAQAKVYGDLMEACLGAPSCRSFVLWGFTDKHSWIPGVFNGYGAALLYDMAYQPKAAYSSLLEALTDS